MRHLLLILTITTTGVLAGDPTAAQAFERLKSLAGTWDGVNAEGHKITFHYEVIGNGSALMERTIHHDHGEKPMKMATLYTLDGDGLRLTHYCVAGNQPTMQAKRIEGDEIEFDFVSATGRDPGQGHMHHAIIRFEGKDRFSTVWTYHKDGKPTYVASIKAKRQTQSAQTGS